MSFRTIYGLSRSENGWRMCNRDECVTVAGPYMNTAPLRRGAAEIILGDFARRYHAQCAPIVSPVWGWSATNDVASSNHLSGTALDINAPQWPWGYKTMGSALIARINTLLAFYEGAVFWGRNWSRPDEMHFQLNWPEGDSRYARIIAKIQGGAAPLPSTPSTPDSDGDLQRGSTGQAVSQLQAGLRRVFDSYAGHLAVDGDFGPATEAAVKQFQSRTPGLAVDGIVGPATKKALAVHGIILTPTADPVEVPTGELSMADAKAIEAKLDGRDGNNKPYPYRLVDLDRVFTVGDGPSKGDPDVEAQPSTPSVFDHVTKLARVLTKRKARNGKKLDAAEMLSEILDAVDRIEAKLNEQ